MEIIGEQKPGDFLDECLQLSAPLDFVHWRRPLKHARALRALASAHVLVVASRDEALPVVIQEAMALGRAVVSTTAGGVEEFLEDGRNALVIPTENPAALADALRRLVTESGLAGHLGGEARRSYELHHRLTGMTSRFAEVLEHAARHRARTPQDA